MEKGIRRTNRIWQAGLAFALLLLLCGCTKKEELLLLDGENEAEGAEDMSVFPQDSGGQMSAAGETGRVSEREEPRIPDGESRGLGGDASLASAQADAVTAQPGVIYVHVCGAVARPGVYGLETGSRVYEAVQQAGGFAENAEQNYVNQAQTLEDGVKLVIPTREEAAAAEAGKVQGVATEKIGIVQDATAEGLGIVGGTSSDGQGGEAGDTSDGRININTASEAQLCEIPGVGATRAAAIAAYRESHGAFEKPEDIMKVNGIKEGMYEKIKDSISVN
ncbi:MAG: helix-hairpin-helix domain-containing protein [Lachnospiraceae bacterium]|nr:helix-hairpin-helix domain-containing protein [Lachnospiraceae bacterium]